MQIEKIPKSHENFVKVITKEKKIQVKQVDPVYKLEGDAKPKKDVKLEIDMTTNQQHHHHRSRASRSSSQSFMHKISIFVHFIPILNLNDGFT